MNLYRYRKDTKEYIGSIPACIDPLESQLAGEPVYAVLENSTLDEPPMEEGKVPVFNEEKDEWELIEDNRGLIVYNKYTGEPFVIIELGEIPPKYVLEKPVILQELKTEMKKEIVSTYHRERQKKVKVGKVEIAVEDRARLISQAEGLGDDEFFPYGDEETVFLTKEDIEYIGKYLYLRGILLGFKKDELLRGVNSRKSKIQLGSFLIDFSVDEEIEELMKKTDKEIKKFIESRIK